MNHKTLSAIISVALFFTTFFVFYSANLDSLGFADGAEFAIVTNLASIAHAPGFPSYILFTWVLNNLIQPIINNHILSLILISNFYAALACVYFFNSFFLLVKNENSNLSAKVPLFISALSTLIICSGVTIWHWSTMIEVYSFQMLSFAGLIYYLLKYNETTQITYLLIASFFIAIGLGNHHLTMILFLPFVPLFMHSNFILFNNDKIIKANKKPSKNYLGIVLSKSFLIFTISTFLLTSLFYIWLFFRASTDIPFKFGNPDNLSRLWYHLTGGSWINQTQKEIKGLAIKRFPYFFRLFTNQFAFFIPLLIFGIIYIVKNNLYKILFVTISYFFIVLIYQLRIDQYADTDAYMIFPFLVLSILIPFGILWLYKIKEMTLWIIPILLALQFIFNYPKVYDSKFNVSKDLMRVLDYSVPKNAIIIVSDWTLVSQFYYFQLIENFRPDIIMMNYDVKFCNYKNFPLMYPNFYSQIKIPYLKFVNDLGEKHPQDIYNTGCNLDSDSLLASYNHCISTIIALAKKQGRPVFYDPKTFVFLTKYNIIRPDAFVSGCFVSAQKSNIGQGFQELKELNFLNSQLIVNEPAAADKVIDILTMLDFSNKYYSAYKDSAAVAKIDLSFNQVLEVRLKMKKNIKFLFQNN